MPQSVVGAASACGGSLPAGAWRSRRRRARRQLLSLGRRHAGDIYTGEFNFPTEGESLPRMAQSPVRLGVSRISSIPSPDPDPARHELARQLMDLHAKLELSGPDVRIDGSTLRFWETQYESDDWGPSINAAVAGQSGRPGRWGLYRAEGRFGDLLAAAAWQQCRGQIRADGAMPVCYTPIEFQHYRMLMSMSVSVVPKVGSAALAPAAKPTLFAR